MSRMCCLLVLLGLCSLVHAEAPTPLPEQSAVRTQKSITDRTLSWPSWEQWRRVVMLEDYNSRVVILGTTLLGAAAGLVGSFTVLRKRALMGDALSHAALPGICLAFITANALGANGKSLPILLCGAAISGVLGVITILAIRQLTRLKEDTALGIVLSVFFGAGISLLGVIQQMTAGHAAGLEAFIYGKTASMGAQDAQWIGGAALICLLTCLLFFKEFKLLCFDEGFAGSRGMPVVTLDLTLMALVVIITIVGLQAVGLILMIALLVIPAASARFWTERMAHVSAMSALLGAISGLLGAAMSALFAKLPSGAMIVLVCTAFFAISMIGGPARGVLVRWWRRWQLNRAVDRQHLLRAMYEILEATPRLDASPTGRSHRVSLDQLLGKRSWNMGRLRREVQRAQRMGLVSNGPDQVWLTARGMAEAERLTRQHRLWELYLITHADIAPSRVDRDADAIEHVLEPALVAELEQLLERTHVEVPASPHQLDDAVEPRHGVGRATR